MVQMHECTRGDGVIVVHSFMKTRIMNAQGIVECCIEHPLMNAWWIYCFVCLSLCLFVCAAVNEYQNYEVSKEYLKVDEILINTGTEKEMK